MASEFSLSEAPLGDVLSGTAVFGPSHQFDPTQVKFRFAERYVSEASNYKFLGIPLGVYLGFDASFEDNVLTLAPDSEYGYCFARIASQDDTRYVVDVLLRESLTLDFSEHTVFPVNIVLKVNGRLGYPHSARIVTQSATPNYPTEILIGVVTGPNTVNTIPPLRRDTPFAFTGAPLGYGFMQSGAVEDLLAAIALNSEVIDARTDLNGVVHASLDARLESDGDSTAMAERLGYEVRTFYGGEFTLLSSASSLNVSSAFSRYQRTIAGLSPYIEFDGFASETRVGAITSGTLPLTPAAGELSDSERNTCAIIDATTQRRFTSDDGQVAYGRLSFDEVSLTGTEITFSNFSTAVTGNGTLFTVEVEEGDIIQDPISGDFFEVGSVVSDVLLNLSIVFPYVTTPASTPPALRRRFTLNAVTRTGPSSEASYALPASDLKVYFSAWTTLETSHYDASIELHRGNVPLEVPLATTTLSGKALTVSGIPEGKAGAIYEVQEIDDPVGDPHIHTINFTGAVLSAPGVVDITQRGPTGPQGDPGGGGEVGPEGPTGPQGQGFDNFQASNLFIASGTYRHLDYSVGQIYSFTTTVIGYRVLFLSGGVKRIDKTGRDAIWSNDHFNIENIEVVSDNVPGVNATVRLQGRVDTFTGASDGQYQFFINCATTNTII